jgi:hypothetical protein
VEREELELQVHQGLLVLRDQAEHQDLLAVMELQDQVEQAVPQDRVGQAEHQDLLVVMEPRVLLVLRDQVELQVQVELQEQVLKPTGRPQADHPKYSM